MGLLFAGCRENLRQAWLKSNEVWTPPPDLTISQWAEKKLRLSSEDSASPGQYRCGNAEYQRGIMDAICDPLNSEIVIMSSAQVGKTLVIKAAIGYYIDQDPAPMLVVQPTGEMANTFSKDRLATMIRDTPALHGKIADPKARDSGNTILHKRFPGGHLTIVGANSPSSVASRPIRIVCCDEVDKYPASAGSEGDPLWLASQRTITFWNRVVVSASTPTNKGLSRIETAFLESDQRYFWVPCVHCGHEQKLEWSAVKWEKDPATARLVCVRCNEDWSEGDRQEAVHNGAWISSAKSNGIAGFHISELYSPWSSPAKMAEKFVRAKAGGAEMLKTFVNTSLGQVWEDESDEIDPTGLMSRKEDYSINRPSYTTKTAGIDIQKDRIEAELVGWNEQEESWSLDYAILFGDTTQRDVWDQLDNWLKSSQVDIAAIDAGYNTQYVYDFCQSRRYLVAVKGQAGEGRLLVDGEKKRRRRKIQQLKTGKVAEPIGVYQAKTIIMSRLAIEAPGPGYCHFPDDYDDEYFSQLTAEKLVTKYTKGRRKSEWTQTRPRNEALDCRVYALAALRLLDPRMMRSRIIPKRTVVKKQVVNVGLGSADWNL